MTLIERILPNDEACDKLAALLSIKSIHTVRGWRARGSFPKGYWNALDENNIATLKELALDADATKEPVS